MQGWKKWVILLFQSVYHFGHFLTIDIFTSTQYSASTLKRKNILSSWQNIILCFLYYIQSFCKTTIGICATGKLA